PAVGPVEAQIHRTQVRVGAPDGDQPRGAGPAAVGGAAVTGSDLLAGGLCFGDVLAGPGVDAGDAVELGGAVALDELGWVAGARGRGPVAVVLVEGVERG